MRLFEPAPYMPPLARYAAAGWLSFLMAGVATGVFFSLIDPDLLAANKRITNLAMELMGAQTLQRLAGENDARAHRAPALRQYVRDVREHGLKETLRRRDEPFGDGYARVDEPEGRSDAVRAARER